MYVGVHDLWSRFHTTLAYMGSEKGRLNLPSPRSDKEIGRDSIEGIAKIPIDQKVLKKKVKLSPCLTN
jgi:hypothetical protein